MYEGLVTFTQSFPEWLQWCGVMLAAAIPFIESYFGTLIGVIAGIPAPIAVLAAVIGNIASMLAFVLTADATRRKILARKGADPEAPTSARRARVRRMFDRFGVPGVSLLGQAILPSQITSAMMVSFGASRNVVIVWQIISIILWGVLFALLGQAGLAYLA